MKQYQESYCNNCNHKGFDLKIGLICSLTKEKKDLYDVCEKYDLNAESPNLNYSQVNLEKKNSQEVTSGTRFVNYLIDTFAVYAIVLIILFIIVWNQKFVKFVWGEINLYFVFILLVYYTVLESITGQTLGKLITNTIVKTKGGHRPKFINILGRTLCRFIPFEAFSFLGESNSGWHDTISKTNVVFKQKPQLDTINTELLDSDLSSYKQ